jgi:hypothetical protein
MRIRLKRMIDEPSTWLQICKLTDVVGTSRTMPANLDLEGKSMVEPCSSVINVIEGDELEHKENNPGSSRVWVPVASRIEAPLLILMTVAACHFVLWLPCPILHPYASCLQHQWRVRCFRPEGRGRLPRRRKGCITVL